jgi:signal transduction histidine kinase
VRLRLPARLFGSYLLVIVVGAATAYVTVRLLVPPLFDHQMGSGMMSGFGRGNSGTTPHAALVSALNTALLVAVLASAAVGGVVAAFVTSRLLRPLHDVRSATRRIAAGNYDIAVPVPREPELAEVAADVNILAATLKETELRRTRLLGDVAHEMRTPLTALDGYVEGFIDGVFTPDTDNLAAVSEELRRLHRLADDLSALSRSEERRFELHVADADLARITSDACGRLQPQFDDANVRLAVQAPHSVPVRVDIDRVVQVLTNVLGNALIATPGGGTVTVTAERRDGVATVNISDTGVGFAPGESERLFERFYRADSAERRSPGSGVGLTIARAIARAHGGDLEARSSGVGRGAVVTLTLPIVAPTARQERPDPSPSGDSLSGSPSASGTPSR